MCKSDYLEQSEFFWLTKNATCGSIQSGLDPLSFLKFLIYLFSVYVGSCLFTLEETVKVSERSLIWVSEDKFDLIVVLTWDVEDTLNFAAVKRF